MSEQILRSRSGLQRGEMAMFISDETRRLFGDVMYEGIELHPSAKDSADSLSEVARDLTKVLEQASKTRHHQKGRVVTEGAELYMGYLSTISASGISAQLNEGLRTGIAFPNNLALALLHASEEGLGIEQGSLKYPSQILGKTWFTRMLLEASITANGHWGDQSSRVLSHPEYSFRFIQNRTSVEEQNNVFIQADDRVEFSPQVRGHLKKWYSNQQQKGTRKTSGCPARHREFRIGEGHHEASPDGLSVIELYADALKRAYDYTLMINRIRPGAE